MTLDELIQEGERLDRDATEGPWRGTRHGEVRADALDHLSIGFFSQSFSCGARGQAEVGAGQAEGNAIFAAFARTALPRLVAVCKAAAEMREAQAFYFGRHSIESDADLTSTRLADATAAFDRAAGEGRK